MSKKILIILGHPNKDSFCGALAAAYKKGASMAGAEVKEIFVSDLKFDPVLHMGYRNMQELEPDLKEAQEMIAWAGHLVIVFPAWWGSMPALLKGFIDRTFLPGFAFKYRENSSLWDKLLSGRSARLMITMDAPAWYNLIFNRNSVQNAIKKAVLEFCGFKPVKVTSIGGVKGRKPENLKAWIEEAEKLGRKLD